MVLRLVTEWALAHRSRTGRDLGGCRADQPLESIPGSMTSDYPMVDVGKVKPMEAFLRGVRVSDGSEGVADLSRLAARTGPMVAPLEDPTDFSRVFVEPRRADLAERLRLCAFGPLC